MSHTEESPPGKGACNPLDDLPRKEEFAKHMEETQPYVLNLSSGYAVIFTVRKSHPNSFHERLAPLA